MKSAYELAMERLKKKDADEGVSERALTDEQKQEIAEIRTTYGARLAQELYGHKLKVYIGASNLLDDNYAEAYGLPQAGRTLYGGFDLQLF